MKSRFLFSHKWRSTGGVLAAIGFVLFILNAGDLLDPGGRWLNAPLPFKVNIGILSNDLECIFLIVGLLLVGFSKEKIEDEQIAQLRAESLQWAIYFNYGILLLCVIFFNGTDFFGVMVYNMVTPILFFIIRFRWKIYLITRSLKQQEELA